MKKFHRQRFNRLARRLFVDLDTRINNSTVFISGIGRSGTTWLSEVINYDNSYRNIFEPFFPSLVQSAEVFKNYHYIRPGEKNSILIKHAEKILSGRIRNAWTDQSNRKFISTKRIIKDIRTNLMLKWLRNIRPGMPIILLIRHPLSVINSWRKLHWGIGNRYKISDFEGIIRQKDLLVDFPVIANGLTKINCNDYFEQLLLLWCVIYYVPLQQLEKDDYLLVFYEGLLLKPEVEFERIFSYLGKAFCYEKIINRVRNPSKTNYLNSVFTTSPKRIIQKWQTENNSFELVRTLEMMEMFEFTGLYDNDGFPPAY